MKKITSVICLLLAMVLLLSSLPVVWAQEQIAPDYENSFIMLVESATERSFSLADFPELPNADHLLVLEKESLNSLQGYGYKIMVVDESQWVEKAMEAVKANKLVTKVSRNIYANDYLEKTSFLSLSELAVEIPVGGTASVSVNSDLNMGNAYVAAGIEVEVDPARVSYEQLQQLLTSLGNQDREEKWGSLALYEQDETYTSVVDDRLVYQHLIEGTLQSELQLPREGVQSPIHKYLIVNQLSTYSDFQQMIGNFTEKEGISKARLVYTVVIGTQPFHHDWSVENPEIASVKENDVDLYWYPASATITGNQAGQTMVTLRYGAGSVSLTRMCYVNVVEQDPALPAGEIFTYDNSFLLTVVTNDSTCITPAELKGVDCKALYVRSKSTKEGFVQWDLAAVLGSGAVEKAIEKAMELPFVKTATRNTEYATPKSEFSLSSKVMYIPKGKSAALGISHVELYASNAYELCGIKFELDPKTFDESTLHRDSFIRQGVTHFYPANVPTMLWYEKQEDPQWIGKASGNHKYVAWCNLNTQTMLQTVTDLAKQEGVSNVSVWKETLPTGNRDYENWNVSNSSVAQLELHGGEMPVSAQTLLNQVAIITGKTVGTTTVTVIRGGWGTHGETQCTIVVYSPEEDTPFGDINGDNKTNAIDALSVLKCCVGKGRIPEEKLAIADINQDLEIDALDALQMLKIAVGK